MDSTEKKQLGNIHGCPWKTCVKFKLFVKPNPIQDHKYQTRERIRRLI